MAQIEFLMYVSNQLCHEQCSKQFNIQCIPCAFKMREQRLDQRTNILCQENFSVQEDYH